MSRQTALMKGHALKIGFHLSENAVNILCATDNDLINDAINTTNMFVKITSLCPTTTRSKAHSRINSTKSPDSRADNINKPRLMSQVGRVRDVVCA